MIIKLNHSGIVPLLFSLVKGQSTSEDLCGAEIKGALGQWPVPSTGIQLTSFLIPTENGASIATQECNLSCCESNNQGTNECDLAFINFNIDNSGDPNYAVCTHYQCLDDFGRLMCDFETEYPSFNYYNQPSYEGASWLFAKSNKLSYLIDNNEEKVKETMKIQGIDGNQTKTIEFTKQVKSGNDDPNDDTSGNMIMYGSQQLGPQNPEAVFKQIENDPSKPVADRVFAGEAEGAIKQEKFDKERNKKRTMKILTPLIVVAMVLVLIIATMTFKYKKLKKTVKYVGIKEADYYTKLDPADVAAEQEAQALINGAYDI